METEAINTDNPNVDVNTNESIKENAQTDNTDMTKPTEEKSNKQNNIDEMQKVLENKEKALLEKEKALQLKEIEIETLTILKKFDLPKELKDFVMTDNLENTQNRINKLNELIKSSIEKERQKIVNQYMKGQTPRTGNSGIANSGDYSSIIRKSLMQ